jgi:hypothetical protein
MTTTKTMLDYDQTKMKALLTKLDTLHEDGSISEDEFDLLQGAVTYQMSRRKTTWRRERLNQVIDILFPKYDARRPKETHPVRWAEKSWWWNGATIIESEENNDGGFTVKLESYVGSGEYDQLNDFNVPSEWIEADDIKTMLHALCLKTGEAARKS